MRALVTLKAVLIIQTLLLLPSPLLAGEQSVSFGEYLVHYAVVNSLLIPKMVAVNHQIVRSKDRMLVNISVKRADASVPASVSGSVTNLIKQTVSLSFDEVEENRAVYYIASILVSEKDRLEFSINILVNGEIEPFLLEFERRYF